MWFQPLVLLAVLLLSPSPSRATNSHPTQPKEHRDAIENGCFPLGDSTIMNPPPGDNHQRHYEPLMIGVYPYGSTYPLVRFAPSGSLCVRFRHRP